MHITFDHMFENFWFWLRVWPYSAAAIRLLAGEEIATQWSPTGGVETQILTPTPPQTFWGPWGLRGGGGGWGHPEWGEGGPGYPNYIPQNGSLIALLILNTHMWGL